MRDRLKAIKRAAQTAMDEGEDDVKALVVTEDGFAIVSTDGSRQFAQKLLDRVEFEDESASQKGGYREVRR